jgi:hypothetical protein
MAAEYEKLAISLRPDDLAFIDSIAQEKAVGRSAVIRWAIDHYRAFFSTTDSTYRIIPKVEDTPTAAETPA